MDERRSPPETPPFSGGEHTPLTGDAPSGSVTLLAGTRFLVCDPDGDVVPGGVHGYYGQDTRLLSRWQLLVAGERPRLVGSRHGEDDALLSSVAFCGDPTDAALVVARSITLGGHLTQEIALVNLRGRSTQVAVELRCGTDFADLFEVKRGSDARSGFVGFGPDDTGYLMTFNYLGVHRAVTIAPDALHEYELVRDGIKWVVELPPHGEERVEVDVVVEVTDRMNERPALRLSHHEAEDWTRERPRLASNDSRLGLAWNRSVADVAHLQLWDDTDAGPGPHFPALAAGVPWFMTLFGRDSLISGMFALPLGPDLLLGALTALARRQGRGYDDRTGEEPGKILHEERAGAAVQHPSGWGEHYYGSVDATPLFVMALGAAWRWGADAGVVASLLPAAERAVAWITGPGDPDGDGFVEYPGDAGGAAPATQGLANQGLANQGLANQGWKDSHDGLRYADGTLAEGPIALVEVQGYCVAALRALAELRRAFGTGDPEPLRARAERLVGRIDDAYWMPDRGCHCVALDGDKRQVDSVTTNPGHLLWCGAVAPGRSADLVGRLASDDVASGFGLRTLSMTNPGFNPMSYHCGSVWPHDTAIAVAGMFAHDEAAVAQPLAAGLLDAAAASGGRLPELFAGFDRGRFDPPVPYPTACTPQAWAACVPFLLVSAYLGLAPDMPAGVVRLRPRLPDRLRFEVTGIPCGDGHLSVAACGSDCDVVEAPPGVRVELT